MLASLLVKICDVLELENKDWKAQVRRQNVTSIES